MSLFGIFNHFFDIFLSIKTSISNIIIGMVNILPYHGSVSESTNLSKFRIFLDFNSPTLVICYVPMKRIEFILNQIIYILLYLFFIEKMSAYIKMHTPPFVFWSI